MDFLIPCTVKQLSLIKDFGDYLEGISSHMEVSNLKLDSKFFIFGEG